MRLLPLALLLACPPKDDAPSPDESGVEENQAPVLTVDTPIDGTEFGEGDVIEVGGFVVDDRDPPTALTISIRSDALGELGLVTPYEDGYWSQSISDLTGIDHVLTIEARDSEGLTSSTTRTLVFEMTGDNFPPSAPVLHIDPAVVVTGDAFSVVVDVPCVDLEGEEMTQTIAWTLDGGFATDAEAIAAGTAFRGQVWEVSAYCNDGVQDGDVAVAAITVGNALPTVDAVTIGPTDATAGVPLVCSAEGIADAESDPVLASYTWTVAGVAAGDGTDTLAGGLALAGQDVVCVVTLDDNFARVDYSSAVFQIASSPPSAPVVGISGSADTDDLTCAVTVDAIDPDGDAVTYSYAWLRDGTATGDTAATLPAATTHRDEVWSCEVVATDAGGLSGDAGSASVTITAAWSGSESAAGAAVTIDGAVASGAFGKTVALVGDVDGDGLSEVTVGANGEDAEAGAIYLFSGVDLAGAVTTADAASSWDGAWAGGQLGGFRSMAAPGDLDGDGLSELFFAAPDADANGTGSGIAYLFYGGGTWGLDGDPTGADWTMGGTASDQTGARLAAGDLDGDGFSEVLVSTPGASDSARASGTVLVFSGSASRFSGGATLADADWSIQGDAQEDELGWTLKNVGDVDGDGYDDVFTTALYADPNGDGSGQGAILAGGAVSGSGSVSSQAMALFSGAAAGDRFGYDTVGDVDLDEDGLADIVVAAYQDDTGASDAGAVYVYFGRSRWASEYLPGDADHAIVGDETNARFGHVMTSPGDVDSDGHDDLLIGALFAAPTGLTGQGEAHLMLSPDWAAASVADVGWSSHGEAASDLYGDALGVGRGDVDGDGGMDFAVGAQGHDAGGTSAGRVYVWTGR